MWKFCIKKLFDLLIHPLLLWIVLIFLLLFFFCFFYLFSTKTIICGKRSCGTGMCFWGWQKPYSIYWVVYLFTSLYLSETLTKFCNILFCATFCDCMPFGNIRRSRYPIKSHSELLSVHLFWIGNSKTPRETWRNALRQGKEVLSHPLQYSKSFHAL